jgi:hypothetical protein
MQEENAIRMKTIKLESKDKNDLRQVYTPNIPKHNSVVAEIRPPEGRAWCIMDQGCGGKFIIKGLREGIFSVIPTHSALIPIKSREPIPTTIHRVDVAKLSDVGKEKNLLEGFPNMVNPEGDLIASVFPNPIVFTLNTEEQVKSENYEVEFSLLEQLLE